MENTEKEMNNQEAKSVEELMQELTQLKSSLESAEFKHSYSEELLEKAMNETADWELKFVEKDKALATAVAKLETAAATPEKDNKIKELETQVRQLTEKRKSNQGNLADSADMAQAKKKISELMLANQELREDGAKAQQGIGEVMLVAKQQAAKMVADAEQDIAVHVDKAKQEFVDIGSRADAIAEEIKTSQNNVNNIYKELLERLNVMANIDYEL